jgi:chitinase
MQHFDIVAIEKVVDWFNVMTYDLHGTWDSTDKFIGPIVNAHTNLTEIDLTMDLFWRNKVSELSFDAAVADGVTD